MVRAEFKEGVTLQDSANVLIIIADIMDRFIQQHEEQKVDDTVMAILSEIVQLIHFSEISTDDESKIMQFPSNLTRN